MTRLTTLLVLAATLVLRLVRVVDLFVPWVLARFALSGLALRRRVLGFRLVTRRTVRAADFTAFPERDFFVFIPGSDPSGGCRILSDAPNTTAAAEPLQREIVFPGAPLKPPPGKGQDVPSRQTL